MRQTTLETERLVLRRLTPADEEQLVALDSDPEVMRFLGDGRPAPPETVRGESLPRMLRASATHDGRLGYWAAEEGADGRFVGWFELRAADHAGREAELGYRLCRSVWGRGYATEGARALLRAAFTRLGVEHVFAETMAVNHRSRRVMEKAGLRYVLTFHVEWPEPIAGAEHGEVRYALSREEWEAAHGREAARPGGRPAGPAPGSAGPAPGTAGPAPGPVSRTPAPASPGRGDGAGEDGVPSAWTRNAGAAQTELRGAGADRFR
ncbi:GNAT family N-acetyltransferase [Streptomyces sp. PLAI1-29]|uniref:GNAT family N-acetyltransferase n=1 Tax=Streptomyces zingiberis TaxID=2053010 RepID=A0ABX1BVY9_9ACTN|nr:GNAT family N-acetyltransferase [Streptomyces zingiberis]